MKISNLILMFALLFSAAVYADSTDANYLNDCRQDGGVPVQMQLQIDAGSMVSAGEPRWFCLFTNNNRIELIDTATLSSTNPSLAATAYRNAPQLNIPTNSPRYDVSYCQALGGTASIGDGFVPGGYADSPNASEISLCMFDDGSTIDTWSLFYQRFNNGGAAVNLTPYFKSAVLPVPPSALWGN